VVAIAACCNALIILTHRIAEAGDSSPRAQRTIEGSPLPPLRHG
jgi:hypothetical protein